MDPLATLLVIVPSFALSASRSSGSSRAFA
jgi:hypothetical protein